MARFACTTCGLEKEVPDTFLGRTAHCPRCRSAVTVAPDRPAPEPDDKLFNIDDPFLKSLDVDLEPPSTADEENRPEPSGPAIILDEPLRRPVLPPREAFLGGRPLADIPAGLLTGAVSAVFCLAFASLAFGASLPPGEFVYGLNATLLGGAILAMVVALRGGLPFAVAGPETTTAAVAALMSADVAGRLAAAAPGQPVAPTVLACLAVAGLVFGLSCLFVGVNALGQWLRYVPHQMLGGVMAGVGLAVLRLAFALMEGGEPCLAETALGRFLGGGDCLRWLPGLLLGVVLFALLRRLRHFAVLPAALLLLGASVHFLAPLGLVPGAAQPAELFFAAPPAGHLAAIYRASFLAQVEWPVVLAEAPWYLVLAALSLAGTMFKVAEVETSVGRNLDLDRILKSLGLANLICGLTQAMPGTVSRGRSLSAMGAGAKGPLTGLAAGLVCLVVLILAPLVLPFVPRILPAVLLVFVGLKLMVRWLVDTWSIYSRRDDYWLLAVVFVVTALFGLPLGVGFAAVLGLMIQITRCGQLTVVKHALSGASHRSNVERSPAELALLRQNGASIHILRLQGFVFLGTMETLLAAVRERLEDDDLPPLSFLILDFRQVTGLDSAVDMGLAKLKSLAAENNFVLVLTSLPLEAERQLLESGTGAEEDSRTRTFLDVDFALEWCENALLAATGHKAAPGRNLAELLAPAFPDTALAERLMRWLVRLAVARGQYVIRQGEPSEAMYFIESGTVNVELDIPGRTLRLKKMGPGTVFGEMGIYTDAPRSASIVAAEDCVLYRLTKERLDILQRREPVLVSAVHRFIVGLLSARVAEANVRIGDLLK